MQPKDQLPLTDQDVEYSHFSCCGDEDLAFLRCPKCSHIWVECYECSTWYIDLNDLRKIASALPSGSGESPCCPECQVAFEDEHYLKQSHAGKYRPTAFQVVEAGLGRYLASHLHQIDQQTPIPLFIDDGAPVVEYAVLQQKLLPKGYQPRPHAECQMSPVGFFIIAKGSGIDGEPVYWLRGLDDQGQTVVGDMYYTLESAREFLLVEYGVQGASWVSIEPPPAPMAAQGTSVSLPGRD
ncbi:hypothetical protein [Pseudoduganella sp.]|uniref:hypothetical protein n=1 Tax=Pseudoduganella sp. TaxID=1880898 RepID=UPI0035B41A7A